MFPFSTGEVSSKGSKSWTLTPDTHTHTTRTHTRARACALVLLFHTVIVKHLLFYPCPLLVAVQVLDLCWNPSPESMAFAFVVESGSVAIVELQGRNMERIATARRIGANTSETPCYFH